MPRKKNRKKKGKILFSIILFIILAMAAGVSLIQTRFPIDHLDIIEANAGNLEPAFILAVIQAESSFRPSVVSHAGAKGLMQIMEDTGHWLAPMMNMEGFETSHLFIPEINIEMGTFFLNWLWNYYDGDITLILSGYNAGIGNVNRWLQDEQFSEDGKTLTYIPFLETRNYIQRVEQFRQIYDWLLRFHRR